MRTAARVDANQSVLVQQLRGIPGCKVAITSGLGKGFPDIVVGFMRVNYLFEIKDPVQPPSGRKLTKDEKKFHDQWAGQIAIVETIEDCLAAMGLSVEDEEEHTCRLYLFTPDEIDDGIIF